MNKDLNGLNRCTPEKEISNRLEDTNQFGVKTIQLHLNPGLMEIILILNF